MITSRSIVARRQTARIASSLPLRLRSDATQAFSHFHFISSQSSLIASKRHISTSDSRKLENKDIFPPPTLPKHHNITSTHTSWKHPEFGYKEMEAIEVGHRPVETFSDRVALSAIRFLRWGMDTATGYRHPQESDGNDPKLAEKGKMTERKWLVRMIFLESVAGVPGMVAGMLRHLHSMRRLKRDNGWIESLLEEAFNERMHLLTFLKLYSPGLFMRTMILGAQGVFFNGFFLCYLLSPRTCHRFVGYLEEEAVRTYTRALKDLDDGKLPLWKSQEAPVIAVQYWDMPEGHRTMKDLLLYVRADEAKHREVNHTLGNLEAGDPNPFISTFADSDRPHPSKDLKSVKSIGWKREEAL